MGSGIQPILGNLVGIWSPHPCPAHGASSGIHFLTLNSFPILPWSCTPTPTNVLSLLALLVLSCKGYLSPGNLHPRKDLLSVGPLISRAMSNSLTESQLPHLYNVESTSSKIYILTSSLSISGLNYSSPNMVFSFSPQLPSSVFLVLHQ